MTTIGLIGSGHIGKAIAQQAVTHGYDVVLSNSRGPETLGDVVAALGERARAGTAEEAAVAGDLVVVTVPFKNYEQVPVEPLAGKVVNDAALPAGDPARRALASAGDDAEAKQVVGALIDQLGFDVVDAGPLVEGRRFDRDKPAYGAELGADALREAVAAG